MEDSKKKPIMIGVVVVSLAVAGLITYTRSGGGGGIGDISEEEKVWVKCNNPSCKTEYEMGKKKYFTSIEERLDPMALSTPPLICNKCNEESVFRAEKCGSPDCGVVFFRDSVPNDFADRCPECGRSETEEIRKSRMANR